MKPVIFAVLTAICWSVGGYFEKRGLHLGELPPVMGITIRTAVALIVLGIASYPFWGSVPAAGKIPLLYMIIGGGIVAGSCGMLCFYRGIATGHLGQVMPVAFGLAPVIGFLMGVIFLKEPASFLRITGVVLVSLGVVCVTVK